MAEKGGGHAPQLPVLALRDLLFRLLHSLLRLLSVDHFVVAGKYITPGEVFEGDTGLQEQTSRGYLYIYLGPVSQPHRESRESRFSMNG